MAAKAKAPASPASRTFRRRVLPYGGLTYAVRRLAYDGSVVETFDDAAFGDEIEVDAFECIRLDSGGHLAPPGWSREDVIADRDAKIARHLAARSSMPEWASAR